MGKWDGAEVLRGGVFGRFLDTNSRLFSHDR